MIRNIDFDIHSLMAIRLVNPPKQVESQVKRQLGVTGQPLAREADLVVRFVPKLPAYGLHVLGEGQFAFNENTFFVLSENPRSAKTQIPMGRIGMPCEIVCEEGIKEVPLLMGFIRALALYKNCVPVHGSAFVYQGRSYLVSSWGKGGKTTALVGFLSRGAEFVADDCALLSSDGQTMYGIPAPMQISAQHLAAMPSLRSQISWRERARISTLALLRKTSAAGAGHFATRTSLTRRAWDKVLAALQAHWAVTKSPSLVFGGPLPLRAPGPSKIFLLISHTEPDVAIEPCGYLDAAARLASAAREEFKAIIETHQAFEFAFPQRSNRLFGHLRERLYEMLLRALAGKPVYIVRHPYPINFPDLYEAMRPYLEPSLDGAGCVATDFLDTCRACTPMQHAS